MSPAHLSGHRVIATIGMQVSRSIPSYETFAQAITRIKKPIHSIIQTELYGNKQKNNDILQYAQTRHIAYRFSPGNSDLFVGNIAVELVGDVPMVAVHQTSLIGWGRILKRLFDIIATTLLLVVTAPIMFLTALSIKLSDPRTTVLFRQTRLTRFNREFTVYKFRSHDARYSGMSPEEAFHAMGKPKLAKQYRDNGDHLPNDPRISKIGRFIRAASIDELPQLINVLKGDLSLVGPRTLVPEELNSHEKKHAILSVKAGITGLAQISGRRDISFEERRRLDVYYVQNWSFWLDITILLRTIRAVFTGFGAK
jgi:lipopolysaccharide/colanic/teichoic acid biosynthesis glycosyltransferase